MKTNINLSTRVALAKNRTHLANERTLLAYIRTSLALLGLGLIIIKFFPYKNFEILGIIISFFGICLFVFGIKKYYSIRKQVKKI